MIEEHISFKGYSYRCYFCKTPLPEKSVKETNNAFGKIVYCCINCKAKKEQRYEQ